MKFPRLSTLRRTPNIRLVNKNIRSLFRILVQLTNSINTEGRYKIHHLQLFISILVALKRTENPVLFKLLNGKL